MNDLFAQFQSYYDAAVQNVGMVHHDFEIANFRIRLCFAGSALCPFVLPALEHLSASWDGSPDLTIFLWDSASTETTAPPLPVTEGEYIYKGQLSSVEQNSDVRISIDVEPHILKTLNHQQNVALFWTREAKHLPGYQQAAPLFQIFLWWLERRDISFLHAGAVGNDDNCVLLAGPGGSGKSTTALTCLSAGLRYLSDDFCLLNQTHETQIHSIYSAGKLLPDSQTRLEAFGGGMKPMLTLDQGKTGYFLSQTHASILAKSLPPKAIFLPRVCAQATTELTPISPSKSLQILAPSTLTIISGLGGDVQVAFAMMAKLVKQIPSYVLHLGADINQIPQVIGDYLAEQQSS